MRILAAGHAGFFFALMLTLSACSDSGTTDNGNDAEAVNTNPPAPAPAPAPAPISPSDDAPATPNAPSEPADIPNDAPAENPATPPESEPTPEEPPVDTPVTPTEPAAPSEPSSPSGPPLGQAPVQGEVPALVQSTYDNGITVSGGDDDSPTQTESLSLVGPFLKDTSRPAGPPSVPTGLVALLASHDWVEFSWVPSVDDQSVEGYEILRNGSPVYTVRGDTGFEFDYRSWLSTSYMDCNYTRYASCEGAQPAESATHEYSIVAIDNEGMRSAPSAPVSITLPTEQQSAVDLTGYTLVVDEEFDTDKLDRDLWKTSLAWGPDEIINGESQYFVNIFDNDDVNYDPFVFTGSTLQITGIRTPTEELSNANNQPFLSGVLNTQDNFIFTYGYVEMNAKIAKGSGLLSTFYLFNQSFDDSKPEIDILEYIGDRPDKAYQTYHYYDSNRSRWASGEQHSSPTMEHNAGFDLSADFHTYSVLWEPELVIWYIDGVEVRRMVGPRVSDEPMNIVAHLVLGSEWIGAPTDSVLPAVFEIDYIKAWQRQ